MLVSKRLAWIIKQANKITSIQQIQLSDLHTGNEDQFHSPGSPPPPPRLCWAASIRQKIQSASSQKISLYKILHTQGNTHTHTTYFSHKHHIHTIREQTAFNQGQFSTLATCWTNNAFEFELEHSYAPVFQNGYVIAMWHHNVQAALKVNTMMWKSWTPERLILSCPIIVQPIVSYRSLWRAAGRHSRRTTTCPWRASWPPDGSLWRERFWCRPRGPTVPDSGWTRPARAKKKTQGNGWLTNTTQT